MDEIRRDVMNIAHEVPMASVLFCDIVSFTSLAARSKPEDLVAVLNVIFTIFDALTQVHNVYKVETIGTCEPGFHVIGLSCRGVCLLNAYRRRVLSLRWSGSPFRTPCSRPCRVCP